jgi:Protein of unknown function (DUF2934)
MAKSVRRAKNLNTNDLNERVRREAYLLWLKEGQPEGRADEHWKRAQQAVERADRELRSQVNERTPRNSKKVHHKNEASKSKGKSESVRESVKIRSSFSNSLRARFVHLIGRLSTSRTSVADSNANDAGPGTQERAARKPEPGLQSDGQ